MTIRYAERARRDLAKIGGYLRTRDPAAADQVGDAVRRCIERLGNFPLSGRPQASSQAIRKAVVPVYGYIAYYRVEPGRDIMILMIRHHARKRLFDDF